MGIIEIILTIFAWRKEWKWKSLIPILMAFCVGLICGVSGCTSSDVIFVDYLTIIILIVMCIKTPHEIFKHEIKKES